MEMKKNMNVKGVLSLVLMLTIVMLATTPQSTFAVRPLSNIMFEGIGINTQPLACVWYNEACGPFYHCCGKCYCDFVYSAGGFRCTNTAFDYSQTCKE
ncbi:hypothetical protein BVRB_7g180590 [Beta vulgaris subsp. vulgaris]|uniref:Embryo surrounding factor 1 brassicaceae domain-containing protein n=1 Tax=Beta vulgaris subsp. vulgaris TaxID=3555 RepID=A0A0J8BAF0_BETVV|nr:hypothetical protein BVRB_7g180590 [Beta vulgaris subsp. vulgaris]